MADLSSLLTAAQNVATAINNAAQAFLSVEGTATTANISTATLVRTGVGRCCRISITTAGSTTGNIYDANSASATTLPFFTIPNTLGVIELKFPVNNGIVVAPGTGQVVSVTYSGPVTG